MRAERGQARGRARWPRSVPEDGLKATTLTGITLRHPPSPTIGECGVADAAEAAGVAEQGHAEAWAGGVAQWWAQAKDGCGRNNDCGRTGWAGADVESGAYTGRLAPRGHAPACNRPRRATAHHPQHL